MPPSRGRSFYGSLFVGVATLRSSGFFCPSLALQVNADAKAFGYFSYHLRCTGERALCHVVFKDYKHGDRFLIGKINTRHILTPFLYILYHIELNMSRGFAKFLENNFSKVNDSGALSDYAARGRGGKAPARGGRGCSIIFAKQPLNA